MHAHRLRLGVLLGAAVLLVPLGSGTSLVLGRMRQTAEATATETVERAARVVEGVVNRHLLAVDGMLAGLPGVLSAMAQDGRVEAESANRLLRELKFQNFTFRDLLLVRPDGEVWAAALPGSNLRPLPPEPADLSRAAAILGPLPNPASGEWTLFMVRRIAVPGVGPLVAAAEMPVPLFTTLLAPFGELRGLRIAIERGDGTLLASLPHDESRMGRRLARGATALPTDGRAHSGAGRFDRTPAVEAARPTLYRDIYVAAGVDTETAMTEWRQDRDRLLFGVIGISILVCGSALALSLALRQRELSEAQRAAAWRMLENALESLADGFVMFDAEDRLVVCNQRYRDLYAVSAPFIVPGAAFDDIIREGARRGQYPQAGGDIEAFVAQIRAWHRGDNPPMERLLPDGRWILVTERRTPDGGTVGIRTDISALKRAMEELAAARDVAAAATEAKSRFLARMSHELRTPLNGVLGLAQALAADPGLPEEARARARTLEMAGRHLLAVANDVLDLARVEAGMLQLHPAPAALAPLIESCATLARPGAEEKRIGLRVALAPSLPAHVEVDATRLRQLLLNLLSNAVKFSPEGGSVDLRAMALGPADA
jgi:signal transduction histidine kinase